MEGSIVEWGETTPACVKTNKYASQSDLKMTTFIVIYSLCYKQRKADSNAWPVNPLISLNPLESKLGFPLAQCDIVLCCHRICPLRSVPGQISLRGAAARLGFPFAIMDYDSKCYEMICLQSQSQS